MCSGERSVPSSRCQQSRSRTSEQPAAGATAGLRRSFAYHARQCRPFRLGADRNATTRGTRANSCGRYMSSQWGAPTPTPEGSVALSDSQDLRPEDFLQDRLHVLVQVVPESDKCTCIVSATQRPDGPVRAGRGVRCRIAVMTAADRLNATEPMHPALLAGSRVRTPKAQAQRTGPRRGDASAARPCSGLKSGSVRLTARRRRRPRRVRRRRVVAPPLPRPEMARRRSPALVPRTRPAQTAAVPPKRPCLSR